MELVTLGTYWSPHEAELAKSVLDAAGIESFVDDAHTAPLTMPAPIGGAKLRVRVEDEEHAREVLASTAETEPAQPHIAQPVIEPGCPECGSYEIVRSSHVRSVVLITALVLVIGLATRFTEVVFFFIVALAVFALVAGRWRCVECGESWR